MVTKRICSFCGREVEPGTGLMFIRNDGTMMWFCSSKCFKNFKLGRDSKRLTWTKHYSSAS